MLAGCAVGGIVLHRFQEHFWPPPGYFANSHLISYTTPEKSATILLLALDMNMARNGYNPEKFESSDDESDDVKENSPPPRRAEVPSEAKEQKAEKREYFADRFKAAVGEKLIEDEDDSEEDEKPTGEEVKPEADVEAEPSVAEEEATLAEIMPDDAEINEQVIEKNIEELQAEIDATDDELIIAENEAAIEELKNLPSNELDIETDDTETEPADTPEHSDILFGDEDEPLPFEDEDDIALTPKPSAASGSGSGSGNSGSASSSGPGSGSGSGGGSGTPPTPPATPMGPARSGGFGAPSPNVGSAPAGPNTRFNRDPNMIPSADAAIFERHAAARGLLVGAVVGYLIGRRRGRIKTERRMNKIVTKLEKQVEAKQRIIDVQIEQTKQRVRREYWEAKGSQPEVVAPAKIERQTEIPRERQQVSAARFERPIVGRPERSESRERRAEQPDSNVQLRDQDIMRISETIKVGATNLKNIFEARLVSPNGLRRIVMEHLEGKDIRRGLAREFLAKELSFERDPRFRDVLPQEVAGVRPHGGVVPAVANSVDLTTPLQQPITQASRDVSAPITKIPVKKQQRSTVSTGVLAMLTLIALALAAYAVVLGLTR